MTPLQLVGVGAVSVAATAQIMGMFASPVYEVRSRNTAVSARGLRESLWLGSGLVLSVATVAALGSGHSAPIVGAMLGLTVILGIYEWALRNPVKES